MSKNRTKNANSAFKNGNFKKKQQKNVTYKQVKRNFALI